MIMPERSDVTVHILAGGLGTRLSHIVQNVPKPMAPIGGIPFLEWQVKWLARMGFRDIVIMVGHKKETVTGHFGNGERLGVRIRYSAEEELLGTGGAVIQSLKRHPSEYFIVLNGDTFFDIDLGYLYEYHRHELPAGAFTVALKYRDDVKRYGAVRIDENYKILSLVEKSPALEDGFINGGIYIGSSADLAGMDTRKISLETEIFPEWIRSGKMYGVPFGDRFIDIGVPEDYYRADRDLPGWFETVKTKALFLDRDGVLIEDSGYVSPSDQLVFIRQAEELVRTANKKGWKVIVITNQAGVAKGKLTEEDVQTVNQAIEDHYAVSGLRIDRFYYCPFHANGTVEKYRKESLSRKPAPGMILRAADEFTVDLTGSLMVGDKDSDVIRLPYLDCRLIGGKYENKRKDRLSDWNEIISLVSSSASKKVP